MGFPKLADGEGKNSEWGAQGQWMASPKLADGERLGGEWRRRGWKFLDVRAAVSKFLATFAVVLDARGRPKKPTIRIGKAGDTDPKSRRYGMRRLAM